MKTFGSVGWGLLLALGGICAAPAVQGADDSGWYLGAGVGNSVARGLGSIDGTLAVFGVSSASATGDNNTAWHLFGGYQVNKYVGAELGYHRLGSFYVNSSVAAPVVGIGAGSWQAKNIWSVAAVGTMPITGPFAVFGKLGVAFSSVDFNFASPGVAISQSGSSTGAYYGLGMKYDFTKNIAVRGEWERFQNVGNTSATGQASPMMVSASLQYSF